MDIHRARFVPYPPSAINALAFSHAQADNDKADPECLRLAVGRANGNIEIWNPARGAWVQERVFPGGKDRSVEGLVWTQEPDELNQQGKVISGRLRLFSIGYSSSVTEWDLVTGLPARHSSGTHSEVWCFAAQPRRRTNPKKSPDAAVYQKLVAGCADGTVVLLSTDNDDVRFEKFLARSSTKKARVLSVTYKDHNVVLAGFADSTINVLDTRNGTVLRNISLGSGPIGGPKEVLVWKVKCLPNGDFVSGDSTGDIRIYDGKNYSQVQRISGHEADVLDLAVSQDGSMIFSGGMDRRTCFYTYSKKKSSRGEKWRKVSHQRYHDHDVKAMATYEGNQVNVIVSGGIDTQPIVLPLRQFGRENSRKLPALPLSPPIVSAPDARLMVSWWNREVRIWRVKSRAEGAEKPKVVARIAIQGQDNITSVSISRDGSLLAVATGSEVKSFHLAPSDPAVGPAFRIRKLEMPWINGAKLVRIANNGMWVAIVTVTNEIQLVRIIKSEDPSERPRILQSLIPIYRLQREESLRDPLHGHWGHYNRSITHAEFSTDSNMFAVTDLAGYLDTWVVAGNEDVTAPEFDVGSTAHSSSSEEEEESDDDDEDPLRKKVVTILGQRWIRNPSGHLLPRLDATPLLLSFQPETEGPSRPSPNGNPAVHATRNNPHPHSHDIPEVEQKLLVVTAKLELCLFEVLAGRLSEWSRKNPPSLFPQQFRRLDDPAKGCIWDVAGKNNRLWLYGEKWLFMFDLSTDFPIADSIEEANGAEGTSASRKRKRAAGKEGGRKINSGAGGAISQTEAPVAKLRKFTSGKAEGQGKSTWIDLGGTRHGPGSDDDDDYDGMEARHQSLASLRQSATNDDMADASADSVVPLDEKDGSSGEGRRRKQESWWHSFKYRPILGIVPMRGEGEALEVVLVERPSWDLDLPPRFVGSHE